MPRLAALRVVVVAGFGLAGLGLASLPLAACGDNLVAASADAGAGDAAPAPLGVTLPQAVGGALAVNPAVYAEVPLRVAVTGGAVTSVTVALGGTTITATAGDGEWVAQLPVGDLAPGVVALAVTAQGTGGRTGSATAELVVHREGLELTRWAEVGPAATPRLHRRGDQLFLTFTDRRETRAAAWIVEVDGAGRFRGAPAPLVAGTGDVLYARTALGAVSLAVLYQGHGQPYANHLRIVDLWGRERVAPSALDPAGTSGTFGGAVTFDGTGFVVVWRVSAGPGTGEVRWLRVDEATLAATGPVVVAAEGDGQPVGGFEPFMFVSAAAAGDVSLVGFVRGRYDAALDFEVPKSQYALVASDGTVGPTAFAGIEDDFTWHREARVWRAADGFLAVWSASDLAAPADTPPNLFYAARADTAGRLDPARGAGTPMFDAPNDRDEPFLLVQDPHPARPGVVGTLAWMDHRAYELGLDGYITLYAAAVGADLTTPSPPTVFDHARAFAGLTELSAAAAGTNAILVWVDDRHSQGIMDPRPELYLDTAWY